MSKPLSFYGQINYTKLRNALKEGKIKAEWIDTRNGKELVVNANFWVKEEADQYNQNASIKLQNKTEFHEENAPYIGNFRYMLPSSQEATESNMKDLLNEEDEELNY